MFEINTVIPVENESPVSYADRLGVYYSAERNIADKKVKGQFFSPVKIADYMASLSNFSNEKVAILDPGCGTAILSAALIETMVKKNKSLKQIDLKAYENDRELIPFSLKSLEYLKQWLLFKNIIFNYSLSTDDFILDNSSCFYNYDLYETTAINENYDIVITNPPYFKLPLDDERAVVAKSIIHGQPNIYYIFLYIAARLLKNQGELISINPRSFTSGDYFRSFRDVFLKEIELEFIHLFDSRTNAFERDSVLQETVIIKGIKTYNSNKSNRIIISHSSGKKDLKDAKTKTYNISEILNINSKQKTIHLPVNRQEDKIIKLFKSWNGNLNKYGIQISTGPVVAFRAKDLITEDKSVTNELTAPLFWLHNALRMKFEWPLNKAGKGQHIILNKSSKSLLIPNKNYIFLRRFSSKDDKSRLVACPYFFNIEEGEWIGVENKLNYIYRPKSYLERNEVIGLSALLNSKLFDTYFRTFNGNINVSATELRDMPLPPLEDVCEIGNIFILKNDFINDDLDIIINHYFNIENLKEEVYE